MEHIPYNDDWGEELQSDEEIFHPMANIEAFTDGLTKEQKDSMTDEDIEQHYKRLGMLLAFSNFGYMIVNDTEKFMFLQHCLFKPEWSLTELSAGISEKCDKIKKSSRTKQNIQQSLKSLWNDPIHGDFCREFLCRDSGEIKVKEGFRIKVKLPKGAKPIYDDQMRMKELLDD